MSSQIETNGVARPAAPPDRRRLAGAPISWGVCEVPGWGLMLPPERVLAEMASLGLRATEMGPVGYLPPDTGRVRALLEEHGLGVVAAFVPLVLHEPGLAQAHAVLDGVLPTLTALGGEVVVAAAVADPGWGPRVPLDEAGWRRVTGNYEAVAERVDANGLTLALHPHAGTLVETAADIELLLSHGEVDWCLDTGHLAIGGADPVDFTASNADRIVHVHLKDVDLELAARVRSGELSLVEATRRHLFRPLGDGDASIDEVVGLLDRNGYERWLVLEQDATLTGEEPPVGRGPVVDVRKSMEYLDRLAPAPNGGGIERR